MTFLGFLIVLLIGAGIGYFFANMRGGGTDADRNGDRNGNKNMVRQRPTSSHAFMTETGEIGNGDDQRQNQGLQNQGPVKPAYSSASVFLQNKDQVDRNQANMSQSQAQNQTQSLNQSQPVKPASSSASVFEQSGSQNTYTTGGTQQNVGANDQSAGNEQTSGTSKSDSQLLQ